MKLTLVVNRKEEERYEKDIKTSQKEVEFLNALKLYKV